MMDAFRAFAMSTHVMVSPQGRDLRAARAELVGELADLLRRPGPSSIGAAGFRVSTTGHTVTV